MTKRSEKLKLVLLLLCLLSCCVAVWAETDELEFRASDKSFRLTTSEDFRVSYNPHAVLSLASLDEVAVVVTKRKTESTIEKVFDSFPKSMPADYPVVGRMMITIDGEQAVAFVVEGMFPPQGEPTHQTLMTIAIRDGQEYNFMIHYPFENEKKGLEDAYALMGKVVWLPTPPTKDQ